MEKWDFTLKGRIWSRNCWEMDFVSIFEFFLKNDMEHLKKGSERQFKQLSNGIAEIHILDKPKKGNF